MGPGPARFYSLPTEWEDAMKTCSTMPQAKDVVSEFGTIARELPLHDHCHFKRIARAGHDWHRTSPRVCRSPLFSTWCVLSPTSCRI